MIIYLSQKAPQLPSEATSDVTYPSLDSPTSPTFPPSSAYLHVLALHLHLILIMTIPTIPVRSYNPARFDQLQFIKLLIRFCAVSLSQVSLAGPGSIMQQVYSRLQVHLPIGPHQSQPASSVLSCSLYGVVHGLTATLLHIARLER